jgi:hypothetical protein
MPFLRHSGYSFTPVSVTRNAPACAGVYGLSNANGWILIGIADNIQSALMHHLQERNTALATKGATGFTFEACLPAQRVDRQNRLIAELHPVCRQV